MHHHIVPWCTLIAGLELEPCVQCSVSPSCVSPCWSWCPVQCVPLFPALCPDSFKVHKVAARVQTNQRYTNKVRSNAQCLYNGRVWQWWGHKQGGTRMEGRGAQSCLLPIVSLSTSCALSHSYPRIALLSMLFSFWETAIFELVVLAKAPQTISFWFWDLNNCE